MSLQFGHCPACSKKIPHNRIIDSLVVCECGWSSSNRTGQTDASNSDHIVRTMLIMGLVMVAGFIQTINWDSYSLEIIPLKAKQWTGMASLTDLERVTKICEERKKHSCVESALYQSFLKAPKKVEFLERLAHLQVMEGRFSQASTNLKLYFSHGGKSHAAAYDYARALSQGGKIEEASRYYKFALHAKPDIMQITITRSYIEMLVAHNRLTEARDLILSYRNKGTNTGYFMDKELKDIQTRLGQGKVAGG